MTGSDSEAKEAVAMRLEQLISAYSDCRQCLHGMGVSLHVVTETDKILQIVDVLKEPDMLPEMSPLANTFTQGNCFWLVAERDGKAIAAGGARFDDLEDEPVSSFWERCARNYHGRPWHPKPLIVSPGVDKKIGGKIVYFGHLRSESGAGSLSRTAWFVRAGQMLAAAKWDPDYVYCWIKRKHADAGGQSRYGFASRIPNPQKWEFVPKARMPSDVCVFNDRLDLRFLAEEISEDFRNHDASTRPAKSTHQS